MRRPHAVATPKFPGNPTRSFRAVAPMIVVEEIHDWTPLTPEVRETWRRQLATLLENDAEIINRSPLADRTGRQCAQACRGLP
ncbi:NAD(+)--rifampin ADP-ribosyltransferase [Micropruina sonneratiae]|uniref:NAD(+)--rifampin ADP-ribosyltransferase n=1 Tax=Micropruina sonneratiae TaxID=2986940 RepID=UPI0022261618|nr:NAD(+)--rifampin ADP-ribosyltransferase [Micropruina sp. KQZ13P-5]MCW3156712.1 NAD(+)--rifampin ADP-ribosyltransferase [Micropruina sp. KQZ13P-5]